jgi:hypothetical protein
VNFDGGNRPGRPRKRISLAGTGLLERMRSTTFAMLGGTALFCLVIVALMAQAGLPQLLPSLPIPDGPGARTGLHEASVVAPSARAGAGAVPRAITAAGSPGNVVGADGPGSPVAPPTGSGDSQLASSQEIAVAPAPGPDQGTGQSDHEAGSQPPATVPVAAPQPEPNVVPAPSAPPPSLPIPSSPKPPPSTAGAEPPADVSEDDDGSGEEDGNGDDDGYGHDHGDHGEYGHGHAHLVGQDGGGDLGDAYDEPAPEPIPSTPEVPTEAQTEPETVTPPPVVPVPPVADSGSVSGTATATGATCE